MSTHRSRVSCPVLVVRAVGDVGGCVAVGESSTTHLTHVVYVVKTEEGADLEALRSSIIEGTDNDPPFEHLDVLPPHDCQVENANFEAQDNSSWQHLPRRSAWVPPTEDQD
eukprot:5169814-Amphidinium_carterae.1